MGVARASSQRAKARDAEEMQGLADGVDRAKSAPATSMAMATRRQSRKLQDSLAHVKPADPRTATGSSKFRFARVPTQFTSPEPYVALKDRITYWNVAPNDKIVVARGSARHLRRTEATVSSVDRWNNRVFIAENAFNVRLCSQLSCDLPAEREDTFLARTAPQACAYAVQRTGTQPRVRPKRDDGDAAAVPHLQRATDDARRRANARCLAGATSERTQVESEEEEVPLAQACTVPDPCRLAGRRRHGLARGAVARGAREPRRCVLNDR